MKILIEALHGLGDTVCMLPAIELVRKTYPEAFITVLVKFSAAADIINRSEIPVNQIICLDIYKNFKRSFQVIRQLRGMHFDYGISSAVTPVRKAKIFMKMIAPKKHVGLQTQGVFFDTLNEKYHFVEANLMAVSAICPLPDHKVFPKLYLDEDSLSSIKNKIGESNLKRLVVGICIGDADYSLKNRFLRTGKVYTRSWGIANMALLINRLRNTSANNPFTIVLIGGRSENRLLPYLRDHHALGKNICNLVGQTSIKESIALAYLCDVVVGVDTGMQHIASAVGTKTVSIFGPTNPDTHGPYSDAAEFLVGNKICEHQFCYGTKYYVNCPYHRKCLSAITVEMTYKAVKKTVESEYHNL